jgi:hypothetical protein
MTILSMALAKFDLKIPKEKKKKERTVTYGSRLPESLNAELLKLPSDERTRLAVEFWSSVVKENAS